MTDTLTDAQAERDQLDAAAKAYEAAARKAAKRAEAAATEAAKARTAGESSAAAVVEQADQVAARVADEVAARADAEREAMLAALARQQRDAVEADLERQALHAGIDQATTPAPAGGPRPGFVALALTETNDNALAEIRAQIAGLGGTIVHEAGARLVVRLTPGLGGPDAATARALAALNANPRVAQVVR